MELYNILTKLEYNQNDELHKLDVTCITAGTIRSALQKIQDENKHRTFCVSANISLFADIIKNKNPQLLHDADWWTFDEPLAWTYCYKSDFDGNEKRVFISKLILNEGFNGRIKIRFTGKHKPLINNQNVNDTDITNFLKKKSPKTIEMDLENIIEIGGESIVLRKSPETAYKLTPYRTQNELNGVFESESNSFDEKDCDEKDYLLASLSSIPISNTMDVENNIAYNNGRFYPIFMKNYWILIIIFVAILIIITAVYISMSVEESKISESSSEIDPPDRSDNWRTEKIVKNMRKIAATENTERRGIHYIFPGIIITILLMVLVILVKQRKYRKRKNAEKECDGMELVSLVPISNVYQESERSLASISESSVFSKESEIIAEQEYVGVDHKNIIKYKKCGFGIVNENLTFIAGTLHRPSEWNIFFNCFFSYAFVFL